VNAVSELKGKIGKTEKQMKKLYEYNAMACVFSFEFVADVTLQIDLILNRKK
jgi:hypothetical protein